MGKPRTNIPGLKRSITREDRLLHLASTAQWRDVQFLLREGPVDINAVTGSGHTALMYACQSHAGIDIVRALIHRGADATIKSHSDWTALHWACQERGGYYVIQALLEAKADPNAATKAEKEIPLHLLDEWDTASHCVYTLVKHGAKLSAQTKAGETPLHRALWKQRFLVAEELIAAGAPLTDIRDHDGMTPMEVAETLSRKGRFSQYGELLQAMQDRVATARAAELSPQESLTPRKCAPRL